MAVIGGERDEGGLFRHAGALANETAIYAGFPDRG